MLWSTNGPKKPEIHQTFYLLNNISGPGEANNLNFYCAKNDRSFSWSIFVCIWTKYRDFLCKFQCLVGFRENRNNKTPNLEKFQAMFDEGLQNEIYAKEISSNWY